MFEGMDRNIKIRIGVGFVQRFLDVMLIPLMVIYFSQLYGAATAGALTMIAAAVAIGCTFLGGHLSDVRGRRSTLLVGEAGSLVAFVGMALANSSWWESGIAVYLFYLANTGLIAIVRPASDAMVIDASDPENRKAVYAVIYWSTNVAFVVGALVGAFLYSSLTELLWAAAVATAVVAAVTWLWVTETKPEGSGPAETQRNWLGSMLRGYVDVLKDPVFAKLMLGILLFTCVQVQLSSYIAVRLAEEFSPQRLFDLGFWQLDVDGVNMFGILRSISCFLVVCLALYARKLLAKTSDGRQQTAGTLMFTAGYMVVAVSNDPWLLIAAAAVFALGEIVCSPSRQALLADVVHPDARSKYMAVYQLQFRVALVVGPLFITLGTQVSSVVISLLYAVFGLCSLVLVQLVIRDRDAGRAAGVQAPLVTAGKN
ncbi:MFS transporter [Amycolatopsis magusensis]|uniref:MFS transporter n=1 Tax=Amycolatopsis magusensis TaxID=882444 RepID=UPI003C2E7864